MKSVFQILIAMTFVAAAPLAHAFEDNQSQVNFEQGYVQNELLQPAGFSCSCHALDKQFEYICKNMSVGTTCARVGNIICYPTCN